MATLCLIEVSRFGLLETELLELLASQPRVPSSPPPEGGTVAEAGRLPMVHVSDKSDMIIATRSSMKNCILCHNLIIYNLFWREKFGIFNSYILCYP